MTKQHRPKRWHWPLWLYGPRRLLGCNLLSRHSRIIWYITNGETTVHCRFCQRRFEPTEAEKQTHPQHGWSAEQQAAYNDKVAEWTAKAEDYLRKNPDW